MAKHLTNALAKLLAPLKRRVLMMIGQGLVELANDGNGMQLLQVSLLADETSDRVPRAQNYGFTSVPLTGAVVIIGCIGGNREQAVAVAVDDPRYRKNGMQPGEVAIYTDEGDYIHFKRGRTIEVLAGTKVKVTAPDVEIVASTKVAVTSPLVTMSGELQVAGKITGAGGMQISGGTGAQVTGDVTVTGGNVTADGIGLKTHVHGGVQTGSGTTGTPQ